MFFPFRDHSEVPQTPNKTEPVKPTALSWCNCTKSGSCESHWNSHGGFKRKIDWQKKSRWSCTHRITGQTSWVTSSNKGEKREKGGKPTEISLSSTHASKTCTKARIKASTSKEKDHDDSMTCIIHKIAFLDLLSNQKPEPQSTYQTSSPIHRPLRAQAQSSLELALSCRSRYKVPKAEVTITPTMAANWDHWGHFGGLWVALGRFRKAVFVLDGLNAEQL